MSWLRRLSDWASQALATPAAVLIGAALMGSNCGDDLMCHAKATTLLIASLIAVAITYPVIFLLRLIRRRR